MKNSDSMHAQLTTFPRGGNGFVGAQSAMAVALERLFVYFFRLLNRGRTMSEKEHQRQDSREKKAEPAPAPAGGPDRGAALTTGEIEDLKARAAKADEHWDRSLRPPA